jgi:hypothetical protein
VRKAWVVASTNGSVEDGILSRVEMKAATLSQQANAGAASGSSKAPEAKSAGDALIELKKLLDANHPLLRSVKGI